MEGANDLFDKSAEYDAMLNKGLALSGEDKFYFANGRFKDLQKTLEGKIEVKKILDFGCGIGDSTILLKNYFPKANIVGIDTSADAINYAREHNNGGGIAEYSTIDEYTGKADCDLCFVNGVFHHIPPDKRDDAVKKIYSCLKPGGIFALFENNPLNPGTKMVMSRIPFDADAITLTPNETKGLVTRNGFKLFTSPRFLFYFPRALAFLRFTEPLLVHLPLGAQYCVIGQKV